MKCAFVQFAKPSDIIQGIEQQTKPQRVTGFFKVQEIPWPTSHIHHGADAALQQHQAPGNYTAAEGKGH